MLLRVVAKWRFCDRVKHHRCLLTLGNPKGVTRRWH
jgi:hypothetical protein